MPNFTKQAIKQTFLELLEEKPYAQITVKDIVETCGINRNSFYYHFTDIPALIEEIIMDKADNIISTYPSINTIEDCLVATIDYSEKNKRAIMHIYNSINRSIFEQYLWKVCLYVVTNYYDNCFKEEKISDKDRSLIINFYKCECFGMAIDWISSGMDSSIMNDIHRICELKMGMFEEMIQRCKK